MESIFNLPSDTKPIAESIELQKSVKKLKEEDKKDNPQNVTNALYVGSTGDLMKLIKDNN